MLLQASIRQGMLPSLRPVMAVSKLDSLVLYLRVTDTWTVTTAGAVFDVGTGHPVYSG